MEIMDDKTLHQFVDDLSRTHFHKPFSHAVRFNSRLRTTGGRYIPDQKTIEVNPKYVHEMEQELVGIIKHELCHYHLHIEGKRFGHGAPEFKALLKATGSPRHCQGLPSAQKAYKYLYRCQTCGHTYKRKRRVNVSRFVCGKCRGRLSLQDSQ